MRETKQPLTGSLKKKMPKYYIENTEIKTIVDSDTPLNGCVKSVIMIGTGTVSLGEHFIVSERGFPTDREPFSVDEKADYIVSAKRVVSIIRNV